MTPLVVYTDKGLYCPLGDFYIDPSEPVEHAVITHAHGDHLYKGSKQYYCTESSLSLVQSRLKQENNITVYPYSQPFSLKDTVVSFHSAGHILGSAQIRIEAENQTWVVSGDYKRTIDPSCESFEVVSCDVFITETTFARPCYRWDKGDQVFLELLDWWRFNKTNHKTSILYCYSLGKLQRILAELSRHTDEAVYIHKTMHSMINCYRQAGISMLETLPLESASRENQLIFAPPGTFKSGWMEKFAPYETAFASGWMQDSYYRQLRYDTVFVISDHADWDDLVRTIRETGAKKFYTMPGSGRLLIKHLQQEYGIEGKPVKHLKPI
jgi:putative mRNA 3-end processing factor